MMFHQVVEVHKEYWKNDRALWHSQTQQYFSNVQPFKSYPVSSFVLNITVIISIYCHRCHILVVLQQNLPSTLCQMSAKSRLINVYLFRFLEGISNFLGHVSDYIPYAVGLSKSTLLWC